MNSENMTRVLQNMIEEAEENLLYLEKVHEGREHLTSRFAELKEAMDLEAELGGPLLSEDKPSPEPVPADNGEEIRYIGPGAMSKEQIDIAIIRRYLDNVPRKSIIDKQERLVAIASLDRLAARPQPSQSAKDEAAKILTYEMERCRGICINYKLEGGNSEILLESINRSLDRALDLYRALFAHEAPKEGA